MRHRQGPFHALSPALLLVVLLASGPAPAQAPSRAQIATNALALPQVPQVPHASAHVLATVSGLRSTKGQVLACLTRNPDTFPDCDKDPKALHLVMPAKRTLELDFGAVPPGHYALALIHDENANGKLDKALMIPREGFGFSRDAPVRMGPPRFDRAVFQTGSADTHLEIHMRYML